MELIPGKHAKVWVENIQYPGKIFYHRPKVRIHVGTIEELEAPQGPEYFQMSAGKSAYPGWPSRVINRNRVLKIQYLDSDEIGELEKSKPSPDYFEKAVKGSGRSYYTVKLQNNQWSCTCPGFKFRGNCKHVNQVKSEMPK